jgi:hypothetical protein
MSLTNSVSISEIKARSAIKDTDVQKLRRAYYEDGRISFEEAESLLDLNDTCLAQDGAWADCFVEMLTDFTVNQAEPEGYVTAENAEWLRNKISKVGKVQSKTELELLINVLDKARWAPVSLVQFALEQVRDAVVTGDGPIRSGRNLTPGEVSEAEVDLLRRILYAFGGDGNIAITRAEAEILFDINDRTAGANNHPAWQDLFAKAIGNCVMAASGYAAPSREEALAREQWLNRRGDLSLGNIAAGMAASPKSIFAAYRELGPEERAIARLERHKVEIVTAEEVTPAEADWLATRIGKDGKLTPNEDALMKFLMQEQAKLAPALQGLVEKLAKAA